MFYEDKIFAKLGLEIKEDQLFFKDRIEEEIEISFSNIKGFSIHKAYTAPIEKIKFWLDRHFITRTKWGMPDFNSYYHDYRKDFEFEIDMLDGKVHSKRITDIELFEAEEIINKLNEIIRSTTRAKNA